MCGPRRVGRTVDHPASPPTSQHGTLGDFWLMATMATMATLLADLLKKSSPREFSWVVITPPHNLLYFFSRFNLGVAIVAMVAMT